MAAKSSLEQKTLKGVSDVETPKGVPQQGNCDAI